MDHARRDGFLPLAGWAALLCAFLVAEAPAARAGSDLDATLLFNQKFQGIISSTLDTDVVAFDDVIGSKLTLTVKRSGGNNLKPTIELLDASMQVIDVSGFATQGSDSASIKKFPAPYTGTYHVRIGSYNGLTGTYELSINGKPPKKASGTGTISAPGEIDSVAFVARGGSKLSGSITRTSGDLQPLVIELVGPGGSLVPIGNKAKLNSSGTKVSFEKINLPSLGSYQLRFTGLSATTGGWDAALNIVNAKPTTGVVYESDFPNPQPPDGPTITLQEVQFGRGLRTADGLSMKVVSPLTTVKIDPISDLPVNGSVEPLFDGVDVQSLFPFNLDSFYAPPVVPRNAVLVLRFSAPVSATSLKLDSNRVTTADSPIQISVNGQFVPTEVFLEGSSVILNAVVNGEVGFPPSPVVLDANGNPVASVTGAGQIAIASGANGLLSSQGGAYKPRNDGLGSPDSGGTPIGFNPGNLSLDFFKMSGADGGGQGFSGFLPDVSAPRLIRELKHAGNFTPNYADPAAGDLQGLKDFSIVLAEAFNTTFHNGKGEWAGGVLRIRPHGPNPEQHVIVQNTVTPLGGGLFRNEFQLASKIVIPLAAGDEYEVVRAEYFEPDLNDPLDPDLFDPNNPENENNQDITNFVEVLDEDGAPQDVTQPVDPKSTFTFRFSEPMLEESFRPYESFYVTDDFGTGAPPVGHFGLNYVARVTMSNGGKAATYAPYREIQFGQDAGSVEVLGFGSTALSLRFHLIVVPTAPILKGLLGADGLEDFIHDGHRGITDLGGQPVAFHTEDLTASSPILDLSIPFQTAPDAMIPDTGAVVHRFLGQPSTGSDQDGNTGITYLDVPPEMTGPKGNIYGPKIADVNLFTNGFLSGAPVQFFQKIHDDFNPPPTGQMNPFPFGVSTPIGGFAVLGGCRFEHVYRAVDCSPDFEALAGTILDLYQLAWAPGGGAVSNTVLPDISIHAGHSSVIPDTKQNQGIPQLDGTGLVNSVTNNTMGGHFTTLGNPATPYIPGPYDAVVKETGEVLRRQLCSGSLQPGKVADFYNGIQYVIDSKQLFKPTGTGHVYHPLPHKPFDFFFPYNNGAGDVQVTPAGVTWGTPGSPRPESLILEYRVRVKDANNPPNTSNTLTFAVGILSSALPRFRIFSTGTGCLACCNTANCQNTCAVTTGPPMTGLAGSGGPPLDPDLIKFAAGPDVAAPGLQCFCLRPPQNPLTAAGCTDQTPATPNIQTVAQGTATNPGNNNFGDNSRYFMVFNYVKRQSTIRSPFVRVQPTNLNNPTWLEPIFEPSLDELPVGTSFDVRFRASTDGTGSFDATGFVAPEDIATLNGGSRPFIQFEVVIQANTTSQLVPVIDEIVIPFRKG